VSGSLSTGRLATRSLRAFPVVVAMIALVTVAMALLATALPRAIDGFLTDGLRYDATAASPLTRDILAAGDGFEFGPATGQVDGMTDDASEVWGAVDEQLADLRRSFPEPMRSATAAADYTVVTEPQFSQPEGKPPASVGLGYDPRFLSRVTMIEGEPPASAPSTLPSGEAVDVIASRAVADALRWDLGETRTLLLADRLTQDVVLSGVFEARDPDDAYWAHTTATLEPTVFSLDLPPRINATVFANASGVTAAVGSVLTAKSSVWFPVAPERIAARAAADLAQQVRKVTSVSQTVGTSTTLLFRSDLPGLLESAERRGASSQAILATVLAGPLGLAVAIEILVARLAAFRLGTALALLAARGASAGQRRMLLAAPALAIGLLATAIGLGIGLALPGGELGAGGIAAVVAVAVAPAILLVAFGTTTGRATASAATRARVRLAAEALLLLATVAAVASVVQRGDEAAAPRGVDVLAAATPLLISLLGCVVALRLYPVLLGRGLASARRSTGVSPMLGLSRALRGGSAGLVPVVAVLVGVSVAVFSGVLSATLATGLESAARAQVGADLAVDAVRLDPETVGEVREVAGVAAVAAVSSDVFHYLVPEGGKRNAVTVILVDPPELAAVQRGVPGALQLPASLSAADAGADASATPVVVSTAVAVRALEERSGELDRHAVRFVGSAQSAPFLGTSPAWVMLDRANARAIDYSLPTIANQLLVRLDAGASLSSVRARILDIVGDGAELSDPGRIAARHLDNPAVGGIRTAVVVAVVGSALLSLAALALTTIVDGRARRRSFALLTTLGLGRRQGRSAVAWELAPLSLVGLVVGTLLGAVLATVVLATVDLRPFTAGLEQPAPTVDPLLTLAIVGGFALVLAATAVVAGSRAVPGARARGDSPHDEGWNP
jgi:putative ABC transport system permease protein